MLLQRAAYSPVKGCITQETYGLIMASVYQIFDLAGRLMLMAPAITRRFPSGSTGGRTEPWNCIDL